MRESILTTAIIIGLIAAGVLVILLMVQAHQSSKEAEAKCLNAGGDPVYIGRHGYVCYAKGTVIRP